MFVPKFAYIKKNFSFFNSETGTHNFQSDKAIESLVVVVSLAKVWGRDT